MGHNRWGYTLCALARKSLRCMGDELWGPRFAVDQFLLRRGDGARSRALSLSDGAKDRMRESDLAWVLRGGPGCAVPRRGLRVGVVLLVAVVGVLWFGAGAARADTGSMG